MGVSEARPLSWGLGKCSEVNAVTRAVGAEHRHHLCQQPAGEGAHRTRVWHIATADWREPVSSDRLPIRRSESPTGYSSAGCSPAEPAATNSVRRRFPDLRRELGRA